MSKLGFFGPKQSQGFKPTAAHLYSNIALATPPFPPPPLSPLGVLHCYSITLPVTETYLFTSSTSRLQELTPMPWTIKLFIICIPAVDKINQQLTIFTADKTLHMPTDFRSSSECEDSHLSKVHGHTAFFTSYWHCKTGFYCP